MRISAWSSDVCSSDLDSYVAREPNYRVLGPTRDRVGSAGLVIRHGYIAAQWGDLERSDMTFSAVKSYLSTLVGLALADGRIKACTIRFRATSRTATSVARTTVQLPGNTCCSRPRTGRAACSTPRTGPIEIG